MKDWKEMAREISGKDVIDSIKYTFVAGVIAHGVMLFNKMSWRNDLDHGFILPQQKAIGLGRWLKALLNTVVAKMFGGKNLSLPLLFGVISILLIALTAHIILHLFNITRKPLRIALCSIMVAFPVVATTFAYMYCAPYYFLALLLSALAVYIAVNRPRWDGMLAASLCLCCSLGIYQAYFSVAVSLFVIVLISEIVDKRFKTFPKAVLRGVYFLGTLFVGFLFYMLIWRISLKILGLSLVSHQGMSSIGQSGLGAYFRAAIQAYTKALPINKIYPMKISWVQLAMLGFGALGGLCVVIRHFRENVLQALMMAALIALLPLCFNLIYVMAASSPADEVHVYELMLYGQSMLYVFLIWQMNHFLEAGRKIYTAFSRAGIAILALLICMDMYYDNSCYLKAEMMLQQTITDMTVMIARIKSTEGYNDTMPVCMIPEGKRDATFTDNKYFEDITLTPFRAIYPFHHSHYFPNFMEKWCGFAPQWIDANEFKDLDEVKAMPIYPDDGSVKIINDTVVVKW